MSMGPIFMNHLIDDMRCYNLSEQDIITGAEIMREFIMPILDSFQQMPPTSGCSKPVLDAFQQMPSTSGYSKSKAPSQEPSTSYNSGDKKEFKVNLDVKQFKQEELTITVDEIYIIVEGKHDERSDEQGIISRQFTRKYKIPDDVDKTSLVSKLSSDGVLTLQASKKNEEEKNKLIELPITYTNQPIRTEQSSPKDNEATRVLPQSSLST